MSENVILTGFEPFGPYKYNPVYDTTLKLHRQNLNGLEIHGLILPPNYYEASELLLEKIMEISPRVVLSTGLSSSINKIRFESFGHNKMDGKYPDNVGRKPHGEEIIKGGESFCRTNIDNIGLAHYIDGIGIPTEVSFDADYYICNSLIYLTARNIDRKRLQVKFGFFHTPWTDSYKELIDISPGKKIIPQENLERAIKETFVRITDLLPRMDSNHSSLLQRQESYH
jgi:pyroglutamyl-peptidase